VNGWLEPFYYFIIGAVMLLSFMGLWFTVIMPCMDRWSRRFFIGYFSVLLLCSVVSLVDLIIARYYKAETPAEVLGFFESLFLSIPVPMLTAYLVHCSAESVWTNRLFRLVLLLWSVFLLLLISTLFTNYVYFSTPDMQFHRGPWFPLMMLPLIVIMFLNLYVTVRARMTLSRKYYLGFLISILPLTVTMTVHAFIDVTVLIDISTVLSAVSMLSLIQSDQIEEQLRQQREIIRQQQIIANQHASVAVLQMRPHFIYNTLMAIYSLCNQDPQKSRQVTLDFTNYLRKNFNAVASDSAIPFTTELEHTHAYLAVEQAQYEDMLVVEYDTPFTRFRLPPLTLQPIVENAVKHGMNPYVGALHISVRTRHTDAGTVITVEDNGSGFDPYDESKPQPTLANIRQRLEMMCGGTLEIISRESGGTKVTIRVPDSIKNKDSLTD